MAVNGIISGGTLAGRIQAGKTLSGKLHSDGTLHGTVISGMNRECVYYMGDYEVTPKISEQMLETYDRHMNENVTIKPIPYYEVSNEYSGKTVIIGDE